MPGKVDHRSVTPAIEVLRNVLRGKQITNAHRYADLLAARTQPAPTIPGGPYHKTSKVYYYTRDARRLVQPPIKIYDAKQIEAAESTTQPKVKMLTPNNVYKPDEE